MGIRLGELCGERRSVRDAGRGIRLGVSGRRDARDVERGGGGGGGGGLIGVARPEMDRLLRLSLSAMLEARLVIRGWGEPAESLGGSSTLIEPFHRGFPPGDSEGTLGLPIHVETDGDVGRSAELTNWADRYLGRSLGVVIGEEAILEGVDDLGPFRTDSVDILPSIRWNGDTERESEAVVEDGGGVRTDWESGREVGNLGESEWP